VTFPELLGLLASSASALGEENDGLSDLDHGLQCAFELSQLRPSDLGLQLAGLVHDIGHRFGPDADHGVLGADRVRGLLGDRVALLVELHVPAKRYLVTTDASYRGCLSAQSTRTLTAQGGPFTADEVASFLASPHAADAVELRRADDAAKVPGRSVPPLAHWVPMLREAAGLHEVDGRHEVAGLRDAGST